MNKLTIFRCSMQQSGQHHWFISLADEKSPGTDKDIDYYTCKEGTIIPPTTGWIPSGKNAKPGPIVMKVEPTSDSDTTATMAMTTMTATLEEDDENSTKITKSQRLLSWIRTSKLLEEELLGDRIHKQVLARALPLLTTISRSQHLRTEDLLLLWSRARDLHAAGETELSSAVFLLLSTTVEHHTPSLSESMFQMIQADVFPAAGDSGGGGGGGGGGGVQSSSYNAAVVLMGLLGGNTSVRMIISKGQGPTKSFIELVWGLLTVQSVSANVTEVNTIILSGDKKDMNQILVKPNHELCELLKKALKVAPIKLSSIFRNLYVSMCLQRGLDGSMAESSSSSSAVGGGAQETRITRNDVRESYYVRMLTLIKVLIESHDQMEGQVCSIFVSFFGSLM